MSTFSLYHNPRCSKSRQTLALLNDQGISPTIIEYIKSGLTEAQLNEIKNKLGVNSFRDFMRTKESEYKQMELATADENQLMAAMLECPKLLERPILVTAEAARIGRPPEQVLDIVNSCLRE